MNSRIARPARYWLCGLAVVGLIACKPSAESGTGDKQPGPTTPAPTAPGQAKPGPDAETQAERTPPIELPVLDSRGLDDAEKAMVAHIDKRAQAAQDLLREVVDINSGSMNLAGVRKVGDIFARRLQAIGFKTEWVEQSEVGRAGHLVAEIDGGQGKRVLLIGHLDTVFEKDSPFQRLEPLSGADAGKVKGPGVADMKGGDVIMLSALEAMHAQGVLADRRVIVFLTGDEEFTGTPLSVSRAPLIEAAKRSDVALGFEGGTEGANTVVVARRGFTGWEVRTSGQRGHSSLIFSKEFGAGAAYELARIISQFYQQVRGEQYLTFNVGTLLAGTQIEYDAEQSRGSTFGKTNVIPPLGHAAGGLRTISIDQRERAKERMRAIVAASLPSTSAEISFRDSYPPMSPSVGNLALAAKLDLVSRDLGHGRVRVIDPSKRGAADVSFVASHVPCIDSLGMVGSHAHTPQEIGDVTAMPAVTKQAALLVYRLTREPSEKSQ